MAGVSNPIFGVLGCCCALYSCALAVAARGVNPVTKSVMKRRRDITGRPPVRRRESAPAGATVVRETSERRPTHDGQELADQRTLLRRARGGSRRDCPGRQENGARGSRESGPLEGRYKANLAVPAPRLRGPGPQGGGRVRYYVGVDWADQTHAVWVVDESGTKIAARVVADFLRTDHAHLRALQPSSEAAQELKLLTEDCQRHIRQQTRLVNQLTATLKAYYPRALEVAEVTSALAREFLPAYPTPEALTALTERQWQRWARAHRLPEARAGELWAVLRQPHLPVPAHVVRAKARLMRALVEQLMPVMAAVAQYRKAIDDFFARMPAAQWARTLPIGKHGITAPTLWARLGDAPGRWESFRHLQAHAGTVPVTKRSGKHRVVQFRFACDKALRYVVDQVAFLSLRSCGWARAYYDQQRARGHSHRQALRALGAKWLKIIFAMWQRQAPSDDQYHLATTTRQQLQRRQKQIA